MRATALALIMAITATAAFADDLALDKLNELRQKKRDLANRHRTTVLVVNETPVAGIERSLYDEAVLVFSSNGHEIVKHPGADAIAAAHAKGAAFTADELARIASELEVETVAVAVLKDYRAKRDVGLPLPTMTMRTEARVKIDGLVYKRSTNQIVWQESKSRVNRQFVAGGLMSRSHVRARTSQSVIDHLFQSYLSKRS